MKEEHICHWADCNEPCPPQHWGCQHHWSMVPSDFKRALRDLYVPGQEVTKTPSKEYIEKAMQLWRWSKKQNRLHGKVP